ncbi:MAG: hypothetical protein A2X51_08315 [Candidatus Rokubacteria bacterium GWC2_70_24]|nr:MAG: hypothetical protein A2X51_08315 [Candidatus Rokubacteria bacterium GWC2_70_24]HAM60149.1 hypothetical protein [Candidatus Rokubacteria bacterium]
MRPLHLPRFTDPDAVVIRANAGEAVCPRCAGLRGGAERHGAAALREQARAEGLMQGQAEGRAAAQTEWESRLAALAESLAAAARGLLGRRIELAAEVERQLPKLALLLTRKVLHQELAHSDVAAQTVIRGVAERLAGLGRPVVVRLAPPLAEAFDAWRRQSGAQTPEQHIRVEADPTLGPGEWLLDEGDSLVDGRIESQLDEAWRLLSEVLR